MVKENRVTISVCSGTCCVAAGSMELKDALQAEVEKNKLEGISIETRGCTGMCSYGPILVSTPDNIYFKDITLEDVPGFVNDYLKNGRPMTDKVIEVPAGDEMIPMISDVGFFKYQMTVALRNRGLIDPEKIDDYIARDGYMAVAKALKEMTPEQIISEIKKSGLRGRGGGGFFTGLKWEFCNKTPGEIKYILCNGDEGDPGAFMDRSVLESDPHAIIEGMTIGAKAVGAHEGYIYVRAEYPLAIDRLTLAITQAREYGLLGKDILGSGFDFDIDLYFGAGAFVCGEETALMQSIEGKRGMPRPRPPFPAQKGLWGKPTVLNNVETFANVPRIILKGAEWFASRGTAESKGTKVFALSGDVNNIGLIEVPMGIPLRRIVYDIGGGIKGGRKLKAVQIGGPSGGCLPESLIDTTVDYESIVKTGAIVGSGGMVVMDEKSCMVDIARFFLEFTADESCGKCTPCRVGTKALLNKLIDITQGRGKEGDIELLEEMSKNIIASSLCGLGQTAPNPVLTTIRYFRDEYEAHIYEKRCPAHKCTALVVYTINEEKCTGCTACARKCPVQAITGVKKEPHKLDQDLCIKCGQCYDACKFDAVEVG